MKQSRPSQQSHPKGHPVRRTLITAATCAAMAGGLFVGAPAANAATCKPQSAPAYECTLPTLLSVNATPPSVVSIASTSSKKAKVKVTAVFNDPDKLLGYLDVYDDLYGTMRESYARAEEAPGSGAKRTFVVTYDVNPGYAAGKRTVRVVGKWVNWPEVSGDPAGPTGSASFVIRHKPKLTLNGTHTPLWGTKSALYGALYDTSEAARQQVKIQFKAKGTKKWVTRQTLKTNSEGSFFTKKFKINRVGTWRATSRAHGYILKATPDTLRVKPYW